MGLKVSFSFGRFWGDARSTLWRRSAFESKSTPTGTAGGLVAKRDRGTLLGGAGLW